MAIQMVIHDGQSTEGPLLELRTARRIAKMTQLELAERAGVDDSFISLLESGKRDIRSVAYETVVRIARALNVTPDELFPVHVDAEEKRPA